MPVRASYAHDALLSEPLLRRLQRRARRVPSPARPTHTGEELLALLGATLGPLEDTPGAYRLGPHLVALVVSQREWGLRGREDPRLKLLVLQERLGASWGLLCDGDRLRLSARGSLWRRFSCRLSQLGSEADELGFVSALLSSLESSPAGGPPRLEGVLRRRAADLCRQLSAKGTGGDWAGARTQVVSLLVHQAEQDTCGGVAEQVSPREPTLAGIDLRWLGAEALGRIYQHLLELEEDVGSSRRRRQGSYYTPPALARTIAFLALQPLMRERDVPRWVLDPALGAGQFLVAALSELCRGHLEGGDTGQLVRLRRRLVLGLVGADVDPCAVELARLALRLACYIPGRAHVSLPGLLVGDSLLGCEPAELAAEERERLAPAVERVQASEERLATAVRGGDDHEAARVGAQLARERALVAELLCERVVTTYGAEQPVVHWCLQFPSASGRGGFDAVLGNPPYQRELGGMELLRGVRRSRLGQHARSKGDLWQFFSHLALDLLRPGGQHAFVVPGYWLKAAGAAPRHLRERLRALSRWRALIDLGRAAVFGRGVSGRHVVFAVERAERPGEHTATSYLCDEEAGLGQVERAVRGETVPGVELYRVGSQTLYGERGELLLENPVGQTGIALLARLQSGRLPQGWLLSEGVTANPERLTRRALQRVSERYGVDLRARGCRVGDPVFVVPGDWGRGRSLTPSERERLLPYLAQEAVTRLRVTSPLQQLPRLLYATHREALGAEEIPAFLAHLRGVKEVMELRRENVQGKREWFHLHWPRRPELWRGARVLIPRMVRWPLAAWVEQPAATCESVFVLVPRERAWSGLVTTLLNSLPFALGLFLVSKSRGKGLDLARPAVASLPWPEDSVLREALRLTESDGAALRAWLLGTDAAEDLEQQVAASPWARGGSGGLLALADVARQELGAREALATAAHEGPWEEHPLPQVRRWGGLLDAAVCRLLGVSWDELRSLSARVRRRR